MSLPNYPTWNELNTTLEHYHHDSQSFNSLKSFISTQISASLSFKFSINHFLSAINLITKSSINNRKILKEFYTINTKLIDIFDIYNKQLVIWHERISLMSKDFDSIRNWIETKDEMRKTYEYYKKKWTNVQEHLRTDKDKNKYACAKEQYDDICCKTFLEINNISKSNENKIATLIEDIIGKQRRLYNDISESFDCLGYFNMERSVISENKKMNKTWTNPMKIYCDYFEGDDNWFINRSLSQIWQRKNRSSKRLYLRPNYYYRKEFYDSKRNMKEHQ